jgi:hypothetical protein
MFETRMKRLLASFWRSTKHFWLARMVARITSGGIEEGLLERAHQHDRPFDEPGDLVAAGPRPRPAQPLREGELRASCRMMSLAPLPDRARPSPFERRNVIVEAPHREGIRREEAMPARGLPPRCRRPRTRRSPAPRSPARRWRRSNAAAAPSAARRVCAERAPQRIDFGHGNERGSAPGRNSASTSASSRAGRSISAT